MVDEPVRRRGPEADLLVHDDAEDSVEMAAERGYPIRADTLAEAKRKLYREVIGKIWLFPRSWINLIVGVDGRPLEFFDLDRIREAMDPERWKETETARQWGRGGTP